MLNINYLRHARACPGHPGAVDACCDGSQERFYRALSSERNLLSKSIRLKPNLVMNDVVLQTRLIPGPGLPGQGPAMTFSFGLSMS